MSKLDMETIDFNLIETIENTTESLGKLTKDKSIRLIVDPNQASLTVLSKQLTI